MIYSVCCVIRLARFNVTKIDLREIWKENYFQGIPSPIGAILILLPLIYELSDVEKKIDVRAIAPYLMVIISILLISKFPTFSFKKISISSKFTIFILLVIGISFVSLMFFTFETLLLFGAGYIITVPIAYFTYLRKIKKKKNNTSEEEHEDIL